MFVKTPDGSLAVSRSLSWNGASDCVCTFAAAKTERVRVITSPFVARWEGGWHYPPKSGEIIRYLDLRRPIYLETARHGHFGPTGEGFIWEKTHRVDDVRTAANVLQAV